MTLSYIIGCICGCVVGLFAACLCKNAAENDSYPCRHCQEETCGECEYWKEMTREEVKP